MIYFVFYYYPLSTIHTDYCCKLSSQQVHLSIIKKLFSSNPFSLSYLIEATNLPTGRRPIHRTSCMNFAALQYSFKRKWSGHTSLTIPSAKSTSLKRDCTSSAVFPINLPLSYGCQTKALPWKSIPGLFCLSDFPSIEMSSVNRLIWLLHWNSAVRATKSFLTRHNFDIPFSLLFWHKINSNRWKSILWARNGSKLFQERKKVVWN